MTEQETVRDHVANAAQIAQMYEHPEALAGRYETVSSLYANARYDLQAIAVRLRAALAQLDGRTP